MKTLLLSNYYEAVSFIPFKRLVKLIAKERVFIESTWDNETIRWASGEIQYPSIVRLKYQINRRPRRTRFNRRGVFRRDFFSCQYCGVRQSPTKLTIDHVVPRARGGKTEWTNVVTSCLSCNADKGDRTPAEAGLKLNKTPGEPTRALVTEYVLMKPKHADWDIYFKDEVEHIKPHLHISF